ncbi:pD-(D/E)xk nuclease superfamily [Caudoviricetes sp.]|nr:pD-(D/E)xk nuclease superfamily [Caudoviricetes sp.]
MKPTNLTKPGVLVPFQHGASQRGWHALESWLLCPKEGQLKNVRKVRPRLTQPAEHFTVGGMLHTCRAQYLNDRRDGDLWRKALELYSAELRARKTEVTQAMVRLVQDVFGVYVSYWRVRPTTTPLAVEYDLGLRGVSPNTPEWAYRTARLDSIEHHQGKAWIGEMKSTSHSQNRVTDMYALHGQLLLQMALWSDEETKLFGPLGGVLLDIVKKPDGTHQPKAYPRVAIAYETVKFALDWFKKDLVTWQMQIGMVDWNATVERRPACMRTFGPCTYRDLCLSGERAGITFEYESSPGVFVSLDKWKPTKGKEVQPWK